MAIRDNDDIFNLLNIIEDNQAIMQIDYPDISVEDSNALVERIRDRTWGFFVFVTDYTDATRTAQALENLALATKRHFDQNNQTYDLFAEEAFARFHLEVIEDETSLKNASPDRLRRELVALIHARRPDWPQEKWSSPPPPARNWVCIALDTHTIEKLSALDLHKASVAELKGRTLRVIDASYTHPVFRNPETDYRGSIYVGVQDLEYLYYQLMSWGNVQDALENVKRQLSMHSLF